jgi:uncharacterized repeat protein (TIGR03803 family)
MAGGDYGYGFIFRADSIGNNLEIVHHFHTDVDGDNVSGLTLASNNKLYGMTASGGRPSAAVFDSGTLFEYDLTTNEFRVLVVFGLNGTTLPLNPATPRAEGKTVLAEVRPGVLYGLLRQGSYVFTYNIYTGELTRPFVLPMYNGDATNGILQNKLNPGFHKLGNYWYATTSTNSQCPIGNPYSGSVMRMDANGNTIDVRYKANCLSEDGLTYDGNFVEVNGKFYGTTAYGGKLTNSGVIYEYDPTANSFTKLYDFLDYPYSYAVQSLVSGGNGKLYGAAHGGGDPEQNMPSGCGILFEFDIATRTFTKKYNFTLLGQSIYDLGAFPSGLIRSTNKKLYGATQFGIFEYNPVNGAMRSAGRFNGVGFAPALTQVCRTPSYTFLEQTTYAVCAAAPFTADLGSNNTTSVTWKHNGVVDANQASTTLQFQAFTSADAGTWVATMTNECGTTVSQTITLQLGTLAQPVITASGPLAICPGESVTLSAPAGFSEYQWSNGATTRAIVVTQGGSYAVSVGNGCHSPLSEAVAVTVKTVPAKPAITASGPLAFCAGGSVTLSAPEGFNNYYWSNGATTRAIVVSQGGSYAVSVDNGCRSPLSQGVSVTVKAIPARPAITHSGPLALCLGESVTLSAPVGFTEYHWSNGATTREIVVAQGGNYTVSVSNGCVSPLSQEVVVTVKTVPAKPAITASGPLAFCAGASVTLSAPAGFTDYRWSNGATTRAVVILAGGSYTVAVGNGCLSPLSEKVDVTVKAAPAGPEITHSGPLAFCAGASVTLSAQAGFDSYRWSNGATGRILVVKTAGVYTVSSVDGGCSSVPSAEVAVAVLALPSTPVLTADAAGTTLTASGNVDTYQWIRDGVPLETKAATVVATESGLYKVYSISDDGCVSSGFASRQVVVQPIVTGIEDASNQALEVYPNPSRGVFQIRVNNTLQGTASMSVVNAQGSILHTQILVLKKEPTTVSLEHLPSGLYTLVIRRSATVLVKKIVIR